MFRPVALTLLAVLFATAYAQTPDSRVTVPAAKQAVATFAGGCFWCTESDFEKVPGVVKVISGYTGGKQKNPTYKQVAGGKTKHIESVEVHYDPTKITYEGLLAAFWRMVNPTDADGQFVDRGHQYSTAIFYHTEEQRLLAEQSKRALDKSGRYAKPIVTPIRPAGTFYPAEAYHQDYYQRNTLRYSFYRYNSGRDQYLKKIWGESKLDYSQYLPGAVSPSSQAQQQPHTKPQNPSRTKSKTMSYHKPSESELRQRLSALQYEVTQEDGTERPFDNPYWNEKREGIYVDIVSGEPLFSSLDKYESGTGWPSFTQPMQAGHIVERTDFKLIYPRTEVRSRYGDSHLGHVFSDGPQPTGLRYCINSAALRFVPKEELQQAGYGEYLALFE